MRLTKRGKTVLLVVIFGVTALIGFITAPYGIDYSQGAPRVIDLRDLTTNQP